MQFSFFANESRICMYFKQKAKSKKQMEQDSDDGASDTKVDDETYSIDTCIVCYKPSIAACGNECGTHYCSDVCADAHWFKGSHYQQCARGVNLHDWNAHQKRYNQHWRKRHGRRNKQQ